MGGQQFRQFFAASSRSSLLGPVPMGMAIKTPIIGFPAARPFHPHARFYNSNPTSTASSSSITITTVITVTHSQYLPPHSSFVASHVYRTWQLHLVALITHTLSHPVVLWCIFILVLVVLSCANIRVNTITLSGSKTLKKKMLLSVFFLLVYN